MSPRWVEPFSDQTGIELVFTEKDHSKRTSPTWARCLASSAAHSSSLHEDGQIYSRQVVHRAHQKQGFSSIGNLEATEFSYEDGKVEGELTTSGQVETFGETWEVKIKFVAPLGETPKEFQVAEARSSRRPQPATQLTIMTMRKSLRNPTRKQRLRVGIQRKGYRSHQGRN
jgi:hypothetical protein